MCRLRFERTREKRGDAGRDEAATAMLQSFEKRPDYIAALDRVKAWTRERFRLTADATIFVAEVSCALPGCPPRETVVAFWTAQEGQEDRRHHFKIFKPVADVVPDDLPPAWLKDALVIPPGGDCDCC
jgi:hypothetical protein